MLPDQSLSDELTRAANLLGLALGQAQIRQMLAHLELLTKWNKTYNLTAIRDPAEMLRQHLLDSLAAVPSLIRRCGHTGQTIVDVGSGAGFPGLTLAVALPGSRVVCVDSVGKKVGFIRQVVAELGLTNVTSEHSRIEDLPGLGANVVTSRALASLSDFTAITRTHLSPDGVWMAMKGKISVAEIGELPTGIEVFHVEHLTIPGVVNDRCLVWMRPASDASDHRN